MMSSWETSAKVLSVEIAWCLLHLLDKLKHICFLTKERLSAKLVESDLDLENEFVSVLSPAYLEEPVQKIRANQNYKYPNDIMKILTAMEENDNPLLLFYTFQ